LAGHIDNPDITSELETWFDGVGRLTSAEIADVVGFVTSRPKHVNLRQVLVLPTRQV
jgi:NADP-dependent 3-hydroxy acid dehydrogenase YdfG